MEKQQSVRFPAAVAGVKGIRLFLGISLYRNSIFLVLNSVVPAMTGFVFWTLASRLYSATDIGLSSAVISMMTLLMFLSTFGLEYGLIRYLPDSGRRAHATIIASAVVSVIASIVFSTVFVAGTGICAPSLVVLRDNLLFGLIFIGSTAVFSVYSLAHHVFIAHRRAGSALIQTAIFSTVRFLPLVFIISLLGSYGIFSAWTIGMALALLVSVAILLPRLSVEGGTRTFVNLAAIKQMLRFSLANFVANLLWMLPAMLLPLIVLNTLGPVSAAHFTIGWAVAGIILMIPMGVSMALFAEGSHDAEHLKDNLSRGALLMLALVCLAIFIIWIVGRQLLQIFGSTYYSNSIQFLRLLAISAAPASINYLFVSISRVQKQMKGVILLSGSIAAVTLAVSYALLPFRGIEGVGMAYLIAQTAPFPVVAFLLLKYVGLKKTAVEEPAYGGFIEGASVSLADLYLHTGRYKFSARFVDGRNVLDIGCGTGYGSAFLAQQGATSVVGGDISENAIKLAGQHRNSCDNLMFRKMDAASLPFPDGSFELVTAFEVIEHVTDYEKVVAEAHRVLVSGGMLVLSTPNRLAGPFFFSTSWDHHAHEFSLQELVSLLNKYFERYEVYGQDYINSRQLLYRKLRQTGGRVLEKLHLRKLEMWLGKILFRHNRPLVFRNSVFYREDINNGEVCIPVAGKTPTTLVIVATRET